MASSRLKTTAVRLTSKLIYPLRTVAALVRHRALQAYAILFLSEQSMSRVSLITPIAAVAFVLSGAASLPAATARAQAPAALPDWSGVWAMDGPTIFDRATVQPPNGRSGQPGVREFPPYTEEWEALYRRNIELVKQGLFPDPISACGVPHGFPRIMNVPDVYEFAVTRG